MTPDNSFPKSERLCSRKAIEALFASGNRAFSAFPLRAVYRSYLPEGCQAGGIRVLISVSKRHFKHAVDRNRAKRQMREAWRLNRQVLTASMGAMAAAPALDIAFIWLSDTPLPSALIHRKMRNLLHRIEEDLCSASSSSSPSASTSDSSAR